MKALRLSVTLAVSLDQQAMLGSQTLKPGQCPLTWDDSTATTNVRF